MSRYQQNDFRRPREIGDRRSRSPPRPVLDYRRPSVASTFNDRTPDTFRNGSDAPRGPRSQFDNRPPPSNNLPPGPTTRNVFPPRAEVRELRDAAPLSNDRGRPYREREDRRERLPSPRERSPALSRYGRDVRDLAPRDGDVGRARRLSRDGPVPATTGYSDGPPFGSGSHRGGFGRGRGRGRGDMGFRGGRGDRIVLDERDLFRRDRSPNRWTREPPREAREQDRREERRFDRGDDDRRPSEWSEREREPERLRRDQPPARPEQRPQAEAQAPVTTNNPSSAVQHVNPDRLALLESAGVDFGNQRRPSVQSNALGRDVRREQPAMPSHLNGRAEVFNNRYGARNSPPPTQAAPAVPEFRLSFAQPTSQGPGPASNVWKAPQDKPPLPSSQLPSEPSKTVREAPGDKPADAARAPPPAPKAHRAAAPLAAPKAPRALEPEQQQNGAGGRLQGARSWENLNPPRPPVSSAPDVRQGDLRTSLPGSAAHSPAFGRPTLPNLNSPLSPNTQQPQPAQQTQRFTDFAAPTGPRAARASPANPAVSPRPPIASPRPDGAMPQTQASQGVSRAHTPPPSAPSGPRNGSWSVSPKAASLHVPTAPKGNRVPPLAPRAQDRPAPGPIARPPERANAQPGFAPPPTAPRATSQYHSWRGPRQPQPFPPDRIVPAKRDYAGQEKEKQPANVPSSGTATPHQPASPAVKSEVATDASKLPTSIQPARGTSIGSETSSQTKLAQQPGHSAQQSFFGKPVGNEEEDEDMAEAPEDPISSSDEELDVEDLTLFEAKYERQKRELETQMVNLGANRLRATTPLEIIARVARISPSDWQRSREHLDHKMEPGEQMPDENHAMPPAQQSSGSDDGPTIPTPNGEDHAAIDVVMEDTVAPRKLVTRRPQPEVIRLPFLLKKESVVVSDEKPPIALDSDPDHIMDLVSNDVQESFDKQDQLRENATEGFEHAMHLWRRQCNELDALREQYDRLDRDQSIEPVAEPEPQMGPPLNPQQSSRARLMKFASEYDIAQVMKESEETARIERERQEFDARKLQADMDKEAVVPDQWTEAEMKLNLKTDENRLRHPDTLTGVFAFIPPIDDFSLQEQSTFIVAYKETPKKWGEIASLLPGRTYKDCIHHYYATKWDGRFRDKTKKYRARGGRGSRAKGQIVRGGKGSAAMADLQGRPIEELAPAVSDSGRPKRAAAPTTFGEREADAKAALAGPSPAKKPGAITKTDANGEIQGEKQPKRARKVGEKGARKGKGAQPLANLAAAPIQASPDTHVVPGTHVKNDLQGANMEHARLLAGLSAGQQSVFVPEGQQIIFPEAAPPQAPPQPEEPERAKPSGSSAPSRPSASSYWSVPEQSDFVKYIAHFGTDFAAIAAHMGTKTQTMIKNHFQRQVEGGTRAALQEAAETANAKRARGENMGAPPTPTPIVKRKYDNPTQTAPRPLASQTDAMEIDESTQRPQPAVPPQTSPPSQIQGQSRFNVSAQNTPVQANRVAPSPIPTTAATVTSRTPLNTMSRGVSRSSILADTRPDALPGLSSNNSSFTRGSPQAHQVTQQQQQQQQQQPPRSTPDGNDPGFINSLREEQEKAMRIQNGQLNMEQEQQRQLQRPSVCQPKSLQQHPPTTQPTPTQPERRPTGEDRARSPARGSLSGLPAAPMPQRSTFEPPGSMRPLAATPWNGLGNRIMLNQSPPKREEPRPSEPRPSSVPAVPPMQPPRPSAPPEPPKRSNLSALLNDEPEQPKQQPPPPQQPKRISSDQGIPPFATSQRAQSPANANFAHPQTSTPGGMHGRQEMLFGRPPAASQSSFTRPPLGNFSQSIASQNAAVKQEPPSHGSPLTQAQQPPPPNRDWAAPALPQGSRDGSVKPASERDVRGFPHHRAATLGKLNEPARANPSPPPYGNILSHSRTPSYSGQVGSQLGREVREIRDPRDPRDLRDMRETREVREMRDPRDARDTRDVRETRDPRDPREIREPMSALQGQMQQQQPQQQKQQQQQPGPLSASALHSNPYARGPPPFSQAPTQQPSHAHHSHTGSMGGFSSVQQHSRQPSREEVLRHDIARQQQDHTYAAQRKREEHEFNNEVFRREREAEQRNWELFAANNRHPLDRQFEQERANERQRQERQLQSHHHQQQQQQAQAQQAHSQAAQQHQQHQQHQQQFSRTAPPPSGSQPPPMQPSPAQHYAGAARPFESGLGQTPLGGFGLRERARREAEEVAAQHERFAEEERLRFREEERMRHEQQQGGIGMGMFRPAPPPPQPADRRQMGMEEEEQRIRMKQAEDAMMARRTPLGRGYGGPPPGQGGGMR